MKYFKNSLLFSDFNENAIVELEKFNLQKFGDFRSMLVNYVQLQMHIHKKVFWMYGWMDE
jgi:hypothetical protein